MDSDSLEFIPSSGSRLLSEPPQFSLTSVGSSSRSSLQTGLGGDDLSLSELYPDNRLLPQRWQWPAQAQADPKMRPSIAHALGFGVPIVDSQDASTTDVLEEEGDGGVKEEEWEGDDGNDDGAAADVTVRASEDPEPDTDATHMAARSREEKLRSDLFVLRQLNGAFAAYNDALRETQAGTEVSRCPGRRFVSVVNPDRPSICRPVTQASREATRANRRVAQQVHQHSIQV